MDSAGGSRQDGNKESREDQPQDADQDSPQPCGWSVMEFQYGAGFDDALVIRELVTRIWKKPWKLHVRIVTSGKSEGVLSVFYHEDLDVSWLRTLFCEVQLDLKPDGDWVLKMLIHQ